jgi:hypothetical protein
MAWVDRGTSVQSGIADAIFRSPESVIGTTFRNHDLT